MKTDKTQFIRCRPMAWQPSRRELLFSGLALALLGYKRAFAAAPTSSAPISAPQAPGHKKPGEKRLIMLDPGHGGIDPGATGRKGAQEKHVVLAIANHVREILSANPQFTVRLTRENDMFIPLFRRVEIAQQHKADLFISIHADGYTNPSAAGASVFALSNRGASSAMARYLSEKENDADKIAGAKYQNDDAQYLQQVLFDLVQTDTIKNSLTLGRHVLQHVGDIHRLHSRHTEQAAFAVLKSPSIPSVLVETAFITNPQEEQLLESAAFRKKMAQAVADGITRYFHEFDANARRRS